MVVNGFRYDLDYTADSSNHLRQSDGSIVDKSGANLFDCENNLCGYNSCHNNGNCIEDENSSKKCMICC